MSTRAVYSFLGDNEAPRHVYKHSDGYPSGACQWITAAKEFAWPLPRYENDEFAAAFVAANKSYFRTKLFELYRAKRTSNVKNQIKHYEKYGSDGGQVRLIAPREALIPCMEAASQFAADAEYRYEVRCLDGELHVKVFGCDYWQTDGAPATETELWSGPLKHMAAWAEQYEKAELEKA